MAGLLVGSPASLYTFQILDPYLAWLGITVSFDLGFPEFTQFLTTDYSVVDRKSVLRSTTELPRHGGKSALVL